MANTIGQPHLRDLCRRLIYMQLHPDCDPDDILLEHCPRLNGNVSLYYSARATFYAPSKLAGPGGMHTEMIRSCPSWRNEYQRTDTVLVQNDPDNHGPMRGMLVARVLNFLSFVHDDVDYPCALVEWFLTQGEEPDPVTDMWVVKPEMDGGRRKVKLIHLDCIVRACHLVGIVGRERIPPDFYFSYSHDAFKAFYVNHYIDYASHECIP